MSMAQGFLGGLNTADRIFQRQDNNEMRERQFQAQQQQMGLNNQYRQEQLALQKSADGRAAEESKLRLEGMGITNSLNQEQLNNYDTDHQLKVDMQKSATASQQESTRSQKIANDAADRQKKFQRFQAYAATGNLAGMITDPTFKDTDMELAFSPYGGEKAISLTNRLKSFEANGFQFAEGEKEKAISEFNSVYKPKLNRNVGNMTGRDGGVIKDIEAIDYQEVTDAQGKPGIKIPVRVTTDKGQYTSYISEMRGIDPDDLDKVYTAEEFIGKVGALGELATVLKTSGVYDQINQGVGRYMTATMPSTNGRESTAFQDNVEYIRRLYGEEAAKNYALNQKENSQGDVSNQVMRMAQQDLKSNLNLMNATQEEKQNYLQGRIDYYNQYYGISGQPASPAPGGNQGQGGNSGGLSEQQQLMMQQLMQLNARMGGAE